MLACAIVFHHFLKKALGIGKALGVNVEGWVSDVHTKLKQITGNSAFTVPKLLFTKIQDDEISALELRFSGSLEQGTKDASLPILKVK